MFHTPKWMSPFVKSVIKNCALPLMTRFKINYAIRAIDITNWLDLAIYDLTLQVANTHHIWHCFNIVKNIKNHHRHHSNPTLPTCDDWYANQVCSYRGFYSQDLEYRGRTNSRICIILTTSEFQQLPVDTIKYTHHNFKLFYCSWGKQWLLK